MSPLPARDVPALLSQLAREPQRPALSFYRGKSLVGRLTYGELAERVETLAGKEKKVGKSDMKRN